MSHVLNLTVKPTSFDVKFEDTSLEWMTFTLNILNYQ